MRLITIFLTSRKNIQSLQRSGGIVKKTSQTIALTMAILFGIAVLQPSLFMGIQAQTSSQAQQQVSATGLALPNYQADFTPIIANGQHGTSWAKGHLVSFGLGEMKEPVALYDKSGKWLFENPLEFEKAVKVYGHDASGTNSETAVVAAAAANADGAVADLILEVGKEGIRHTLRTTPFRVIKVCESDEGKVWAYGEEITEDRKSEPRIHYPMLREYSFDKGELRSTLDRATFHPPQGVPLSGTRGDVYLQCAPGNIVLVSGPTNELIKYELASNKLSRSSIAPLPERSYITGTAVTESAEVYISVLRPGQNAQTSMLQLQVNSSGTAEWTPIAMGPAAGGKFFILLGNDGQDLVYSRGRSAPTLFWSKAQGEAAK